MPPRSRRSAPRLVILGLALRLPLGLALLLTWVAPASGAEPMEAVDRVVLLHGLARAPRAMRPLEERLAREGYRVHNLGYPSRSDPPESLVAHLRAAVEDCCPGADPVHFVGHSLGGILVRALLAEHRPEGLGRVVMLAPPNQGSELVDRFGDDPWFAPILGPTAAQLGTDAGSLPNRLPAPDYELGVIAAAHPMASQLGRWLMSGRTDGIVSVASTRLPGMTDFRLVESGHVRIRTHEVVADETVHFLQHGRFASGERSGALPALPDAIPAEAPLDDAAGLAVEAAPSHPARPHEGEPR